MLYPGIIAGIPGALIEDVSLSDIYWHKVGGADKKIADTEPDEQVKGYPDPTRFPTMFPAHGLFVRHVRNLEMTNIEFRLDKADARPAIWAHDVRWVGYLQAEDARLQPVQRTLCSGMYLIFGSSGSPRIADKTIAKVDQSSF